ncbi:MULTISPECIES: N-acyl homoserine lactonase family protein [Mammaliicoccus]|uniref:N-acyl homoserine lactonase family protein n=2 Tax=Mammaliicoccus sciuri TaxID=1296 RepID=A0AAJ4VIQ7_MAMSC|nr:MULTISPECIES: N-acyl homoserine lactonase family protein [Mammaliicoccus]MBF9298072.1 N-acyl homoserine lactonase family protein [Staphylococcus schleiferi]MBN4908928.1 N-acyl homoserine lactonase family protein [Staphylococcus sp. EG-SA-13]MCJ0942675.1 N-acyl homoserine lactonase family protein [Mammaliicoccus sciuri]MCJ1748784.1 N-acyl homoserine lactonase family protein [Mammaliicoccus sciuri]MDO0948164.1 N-acyl homoserine lactonase family protein [Mammaliicoccus sciuri]
MKLVNDIKIHVLHTGTVIVDEALPFSTSSRNPIAWTGLFRNKRHQISLPVSVYLIEHPKGLVLIDTGWHTDNRVNQKKNLLFQYPVNKASLPEGQAVHEQLRNLGYEIDDIDYVLMSHMHCDHADGLRHVKNAKKILLSEPEYEAIKSDKMHYLPHEWKDVDLSTFKLSYTNIGPKGYSFDLFGDGTLQMVWCPGHSKGLCATLVKKEGQDKFVLLASDVGYANRSWERNILPGVLVNRKDAQESLNWVKYISEDKNCIKAIANHDDNTEPQTIIL